MKEPKLVTCPHCQKTRMVSWQYITRKCAQKSLQIPCASCSIKVHWRKRNTYRKKVEHTEIKVNGCILKQGYEGDRCDDYITCKHYRTCLYAVEKENWDGWIL